MIPPITPARSANYDLTHTAMLNDPTSSNLSIIRPWIKNIASGTNPATIYSISSIINAYINPQNWLSIIHPDWLQLSESSLYISKKKHSFIHKFLRTYSSSKQKGSFQLSPQIALLAFTKIIAPFLSIKRLFIDTKSIQINPILGHIIHTNPLLVSTAIEHLGILDIYHIYTNTIDGSFIQLIRGHISPTYLKLLDFLTEQSINIVCATNLTPDTIKTAIKTNNIKKIIYNYSIARLYNIFGNVAEVERHFLMYKIPPTMHHDLLKFQQHPRTALPGPQPFLTQLNMFINYLALSPNETT